MKRERQHGLSHGLYEYLYCNGIFFFYSIHILHEKYLPVEFTRGNEMNLSLNNRAQSIGRWDPFIYSNRALTAMFLAGVPTTYVCS